MVPLGPLASRYLRSWLGEVAGPGLLALPHALDFPRPGLWGDDAARPRSVVLLREGDGPREAFGAGDPGPAVAWLARQSGTVALLAPGSWEGSLRGRSGLSIGATSTPFSAWSRAARIAQAPPPLRGG